MMDKESCEKCINSTHCDQHPHVGCDFCEKETKKVEITKKQGETMEESVKIKVREP